MTNLLQGEKEFGIRSVLVVGLLLVLGGGLLVGCGSGSERTAGSDSTPGESSVRSGTVEGIKTADRDIESETILKDIRIGVSLNEPDTIYKGEEVASPADENGHQLRVVLREGRTKRKLPGAEVQVQFLDGNGNDLEEEYLLETWGDYYFYGKNLDVPDGAETLRVNVTPPLIGRHEDMKELYVDPVTTQFKFSRKDGERTLEGTKPTNVDDAVRLGSDVETAVEEALELRTSGGYRIGFVAESSEPFWVFTRHGDNNDSPRSLKMADFPQSANRHLEVVLFDETTHRIVPHAGVTLDVRSRDGDARTRIELPFLMSAFNHYGNSLYLPKADYRVNVEVTNPDLHTLEQGRFPERAATRFNWSPGE